MFQLFFAAVILLAGATSHADTTLIGRYNLPDEGNKFGGLSAVHMRANGASLVAVSDRGQIFEAQVIRNLDGTIVDMVPGALHRLNVPTDKGRVTTTDAEGIAVAADGTIFVSFEGYARVASYDALGGTNTELPRPREFDALQNNSALEALAITLDGALFAIPERSGRFDLAFPMYRYRNGTWDQPYAIPRTGTYLVVGADFGPDGLLYILERDFTGFGFYSRVRRIDLNAQTAETILETGIGLHGNMEGISVWKNAAGELVMTLMADNNFRRFLTNEVVEYRIDG